MAKKISFEIPAGIKLEDAPEFYAQCIRQIEEYNLEEQDADQFLALYAEALKKTRAATLAACELTKMYWEPGPRYEAEARLRHCFENRPKFDAFEEVLFTWSLIEFAGRRALKEGVSKRTSDAAKSKNAMPREWVLRQWQTRTDKGQSKAAFARQHAALVKRRFDLDVTPDTIGRDWLPKGKDPAA